MSTPAKKVKKKPKPVKTSLHSPYSCRWGALEKRHNNQILDIFKNKITNVGLKFQRVKKSREWGNKRKSRKLTLNPREGLKSPAEDQKPPPPAEDQKPVLEGVNPLKNPPNVTKSCWSNVLLRKQLTIGINEVTRSLERDELSLVVVCGSVKPSHMTWHLIPLSATRSVPACRVPGLSASLSEVLGLKCVLALGVRRDAKQFVDMVKAITPLVPPLEVPWLSIRSTTKVVPPKNKTLTSGRKRKLEESSPQVLQPLKVRRIVPNPKKIKKAKRKKNQKPKQKNKSL